MFSLGLHQEEHLGERLRCRSPRGPEFLIEHEFPDRRVSCARWTALGRPGVRHCRAHRQEWLLRVRFLQNEAKLSVAAFFVAL